MQPILDFQDILLKNTNNDFRRFLHDKINWDQRMIGIKGPRGAGTTTLRLQHLKYELGTAWIPRWIGISMGVKCF